MHNQYSKARNENWTEREKNLYFISQLKDLSMNCLSSKRTDFCTQWQLTAITATNIFKFLMADLDEINILHRFTWA